MLTRSLLFLVAVCGFAWEAKRYRAASPEQRNDIAGGKALIGLAVVTVWLLVLLARAIF